MAVPTRTVNIPKPRRFKVVFVNRINDVVNKSTSSHILTKQATLGLEQKLLETSDREEIVSYTRALR